MDPSMSPFSPSFVHNGSPPDLRIVAADAVDYHVHVRILLAASSNDFGGHIANGRPLALSLPETSVVLDILFRVIYAISCLDGQRTLEASGAAIDALNKYGMSISHHAAPPRPLGQLILALAPGDPIEAYALAAHHALEPLAVPISALLLAYDFSLLSDELVVRMGAVYLSRLFSLQRTRLAALRNIVLALPARHPVTPMCDQRAQGQLDRVWAFATADLVWNALADISTETLSTTFERAGAAITCSDCRGMIRRRSEEVITQWSAVKCTI